MAKALGALVCVLVYLSLAKILRRVFPRGSDDIDSLVKMGLLLWVLGMGYSTHSQKWAVTQVRNVNNRVF